MDRQPDADGRLAQIAHALDQRQQSTAHYLSGSVLSRFDWSCFLPTSLSLVISQQIRANVNFALPVIDDRLNR